MSTPVNFTWNYDKPKWWHRFLPKSRRPANRPRTGTVKYWQEGVPGVTTKDITFDKEGGAEVSGLKPGVQYIFIVRTTSRD